MIPKVIHYCWFGNNRKTRLMKKCIRSWKKLCPDYTLIEWNERNFDISQTCAYVQEAYSRQKWAFVSDYVRMWVLYKYGGVYLDTDVELIKPLDNLLDQPAFFGYQDERLINTGLGCGSEKGNPVVRCILEDYEKIHFIDETGEMDLMPCTVRNTRVFTAMFGQIEKNNHIVYLPNAVLYPKEYFSPIDCKTLEIEVTDNTYSIHWFAASWVDGNSWIEREYGAFYKKVSRVLGDRLTYVFVTIYYSLFRKKELKYLHNKWNQSA